MVAIFSRISQSLLFAILVGGVVAVTSPIMAQAATPRNSGEQRANQVYTKANPSVVTVRAGSAFGSGFVINKDGTIITNAHVVQGAPSVVTVVFPNGQEYPADVLGFSKGGLDLAMLKIHPRKPIAALVLAVPGTVQVGDQVYVIGTPLDLNNSNTLTQGVVSRLVKKPSTIQHSAAINHGNSGGPLLNSLGQVIGVNTWLAKSIVTDSQGQFLGWAEGSNGVGYSIGVDQLRAFIAAAGRRDLSPVSTLGEVSAAVAEQQKTRSLAVDGQLMAGALATGDKQLNDGSWADEYVFQGQAGQTVVIEMNSTEFNPFLLLYQEAKDEQGKPTAQKIAANDDAAPGTTNARMTFKLPVTGQYTVFASSSSVGEQGKYQLRVTLP